MSTSSKGITVPSGNTYPSPFSARNAFRCASEISNRTVTYSFTGVSSADSTHAAVPSGRITRSPST